MIAQEETRRSALFDRCSGGWLRRRGAAAEMTFYQLPPGAFPHDVAPAADGSVWTAASAGICRTL